MAGPRQNRIKADNLLQNHVNLRNENVVVTLGSPDAHQRRVALPIALTEYYDGPGNSRLECVLSMGRADIADYLNLAVETVNRLFSRLQPESCVQVMRGAVSVLNLRGRYNAAGMHAPRHLHSPQMQ